MNPTEAYNKYNDAETAACNDYRDYWIAKFSAVGITLTAGQWYGTLIGLFNGYQLSASVRPAHFNGIQIEISRGPSIPYPMCNCKVKSDTGFNKLVSRLRRRAYL